MEAPPASLKAQAFTGLAALALIVGLVVFGSAGTFRYVEGWVFLIVFFGPSLAITLHLLGAPLVVLRDAMYAGALLLVAGIPPALGSS
jgi:hypothetical protein